MNALQNVTAIGSKNVFRTIRTFLNRYKDESENTAQSYERNIRLFFKIVKNKEIEDLSVEDLKINLSDVTEYQTLLKQSGKYKNSSITQMVESVRSLYNYLKADEFDVNPMVFKGLKKLTDDRVNVGFLSSDEAKVIADLALYEKHKGVEKRALILLAVSTSIRKDAILKIKYSDIMPHTTKEDMYVIASDELFDKGAMIKDKEIHKNLYDMLLALKNPEQKDDLIFTIAYDSLNSIIKRLCIAAGFDPKRSISFHSLKRAGVHLAFEIGGLHAAQMQGGHKSSDTTTRYISRESNIVGSVLFEDIEENVFDDLSRDEMIKLLKSFGNGTGLQLRRKAQEIMNEREE